MFLYRLHSSSSRLAIRVHDAGWSQSEATRRHFNFNQSGHRLQGHQCQTQKVQFFKLCLKLSLLYDESRRLSGNEFQAAGPQQRSHDDRLHLVETAERSGSVDVFREMWKGCSAHSRNIFTLDVAYFPLLWILLLQIFSVSNCGIRHILTKWS